MKTTRKKMLVISILITGAMLLSLGVWAGTPQNNTKSIGTGSQTIVEPTNTDIAQSNTEPEVTQQKPTISPTNPVCSTGRVIVYFKAGIPKKRHQEIINQANSTVYREYDNFNGYALNTGEGQEVRVAQELSSTEEVASAVPENCPDATQTPSSN